MKTAPPDPDLVELERRMYEIVTDIKFKQSRQTYIEKRMKKLLRQISEKQMLVIKSDKTNNYYFMTPEEYYGLMEKELHKEYKIDKENSIEDKINKNAKDVGDKLGISERLEVVRKVDTYLLLKDHKDSFYREKQCRLINPTKNQLGIVSKKILDVINAKARSCLKVNQLRSTQDAIDWYNQIEDKKTKTLLKADIKEFYPSINEKVIKNALQYMKSKGIVVSDEEEEYILKAKVQIASSLNINWVKKKSPFDNSMGANDSCELCELVGLFLLAKIKDQKKEVISSIAIYRDDVIITLKKHGKQINETKSILTKLFKDEGLTLCEWDEGTKMTYLDIEFSLHDGTYRPFKKPNDNSKYLSKHSDHPKKVLESVPLTVAHRINMLCSNQEIFSSVKNDYEMDLKLQGYKNVSLEYKPPENLEERMVHSENKKKKNEKKSRQILWFVPPFTKQIDRGTSVGRKFFTIIDTCIPKTHPLHKIINRNTIKMSYRTMPNFGKIVKGLNKKVTDKFIKKRQKESDKNLNESKKPRGRPKYATKKDCNCARTHPCPLDNKCNRSEVVYKAVINSSNEEINNSFYIGGALEFKKRYSNHLQTFRNKEVEQECSLKDFVWDLKERQIEFTVQWEILKQSRSYRPGDKACSLCVDEKLYVLENSKNNKLINKDILNMEKCRHKNKYLVLNWKRCKENSDGV